MPKMRVASRQIRTLSCTAAGLATIVAAAVGSGQVVAQDAHTSADRAAVVRAATRPPRTHPVALRDVAAARLVHRNGYEPRPGNYKANHRRANKKTIRRFRRHSGLPHRYEKRVTGRFRGTTDEILQWGAYKWGFAPDLFRAIATLESWWHWNVVGDHGRSFGLMQIKRGAHCCYPATRLSSAFNVDYYGAWLRTVYDGKLGWLRHVPHSRPYRRGDLWGSVGTWYSGQWHLGNAWYYHRIQRIIRKHVWHRSGFKHG